MAEELTIRDYLSLARTFAWVANEGICHAASKRRKVVEMRPYQHPLARAIDALDDVRLNRQYDEILDQPPFAVGLPPTLSLQKLAAIVLQWRGTGAVTIGESSFSCEAAKEVDPEAIGKLEDQLREGFEAMRTFLDPNHPLHPSQHFAMIDASEEPSDDDDDDDDS